MVKQFDIKHLNTSIFGQFVLFSKKSQDWIVCKNPNSHHKFMEKVIVPI